MSARIKFAWTLLGTIIFAIAAVNTASAGSVEDAIAARGRGDYATAMRLMRPLAEQGNADAQDSLGAMYEWGQGLPQDKAEAAKWYAKAAEGYREAADRGDADAQYKLGDMYYFGRGVPENCAEAARWYRQAAEQGQRRRPGQPRRHVHALVSLRFARMGPVRPPGHGGNGEVVRQGG
jgi:TPR repeat protein